VRFRTAAILSVVLVGGILFLLPAVVRATLLPSLLQNPQTPVPGYDQIIFRVVFFCLEWRWLLAPTTVLVLFFIAAVTRESAHTQNTALPGARRVR
jgi:type II secretory pathway component PulF